MMKPIEFKEANMVLAKDQPQYLPLPAFRTADGEIISCWRLNWRDRLTILLGGRLWLRVLTFGDPLQPQLPQVASPFVRGKLEQPIE